MLMQPPDSQAQSSSTGPADALVVHDTEEYRIEAANSEARRLFDLNPHGAQEKGLADLLPDAEPFGVGYAKKVTRHLNERSLLLWVYQTPEGTPFWAEAHLRMVAPEDQARVVGVLRPFEGPAWPVPGQGWRFPPHLLDKTSVPALIVDPGDDQITRANGPVANLLGYSPKELRGMSARALHPHEAEEYQRYKEEVLGSDLGWTNRLSCRHRTGRLIPVRVLTLRADVGGTGRLVHLVQEAAPFGGAKAKSQSHFRRLVERSPAGIYVFQDGAYRYVNPRFEELTGYPAEEIIGEMGPEELAHPDDQGLIKEELEQRQAGETGEVAYDFRLICRDGKVQHVEYRGSRVTWWGEPAILGQLWNVTERKKSRRALQAERDRWAALFENASDPIMEVRFEEGTPVIRQVNPAFEDVFGIEAEEASGQVVSEVVVPESEQSGHERLKDRVLRGERVETEVQRKTAEGVRRFILQIVPVDVTDASLGAYAWYTDIAEQKKRERKLRMAKEEAKQASQAKSAMLANMSHEVRTPLTSILGFAERIREEAAEESSTLQFAKLIEKSGHRLLETLEAVLNLSKLEAGEMDLSVKPVDLAEQTRQVAELFTQQAEEAGVDLRIDAEPRPLWAHADERGIQMVARNLLSNALKYTEEGGQVQVRTYRDADQAVLEVEDTGIGMEPETEEEIFEPFRQASEGLGREYEGTGLGLSIVRKLARRMEGEVGVESQKGEGSRFIVRLPGDSSP